MLVEELQTGEYEKVVQTACRNMQRVNDGRKRPVKIANLRENA